jgi:NADH-quinone oxidoreductase subunit C
MDASAIVETLRRAAPGAAVDALPAIDMPTLAVGAGHLLDVARALRDDPALQFVFLADVAAVDRLPAEPRFEVVYHLASLGPAVARQPGGPPPRRVRLKVRVPADRPIVPSVVDVWPTANWPEREAWDLMGIAFDGHPDLRRVLMPDDWEGHPLRKDYPVQIRKDTASWSPLQMTVEEFAESIRAQRRQAARAVGGDRSGDA